MAAPLAPETLFQIGQFPFTNTVLHTLIVDVIVLGGLIALNKNFKKIPGLFQNALEYIIEGLYSLTDSIAGKNAGKVFPWFISFFLFIMITNLTALFPGFGTIFVKKGDEMIPLLRSATSDINTTLALAIIATITTQILAVRSVGIKGHLARYFSWNPIFLFVGLLELLSVFTNIISLSFRLFGNIFAGEAVLSTISAIFAFFLPLPFLALELLVAVVQALVFAILTMGFMTILMTPHHEEEGNHAK
jgi:F-type H+-transporting ATPase subunit a